MDDKELHKNLDEPVKQLEPISEEGSTQPVIEQSVPVDAPAFTPTLEQKLEEVVVGGKIGQEEAEKGFKGVLGRVVKLHPNEKIRSFFKKAA